MKNIISIHAGTENLTEKIQEILSGLNPLEENIIEFEKGTYYFYRKGSRLHRIFASSTTSGENHVIFPIIGQKNLTIDGGGSDFVFCDRVQPFMVQDSENITFQNFQTDFSFLRYAYGTVTHTDDEGFTVAIDPAKFNYYVEDGYLHFVCGEDILSTRNRKISMKRIEPTKSGVFFLYGIGTQATINPAAPTVMTYARACSDGVRFDYETGTNHVSFEIGDVICLAYDNDREAQTFFSENSQNICVENVTIHRGGGMGFVADVCENISLDHFKIQLKDGRSEYYTTTADGVFLTNCSGRFTMKHSLIRDTYDDAMNIHGFYLTVSRVISDTEAELVHLHPAHGGLVPCKSQDVVRVSRREDFMDIGELKIVDVSANPDRTLIHITHDGSLALVAGMLIESAARMPEVWIENNTFANSPHIRLSAGKMMIRNNHFSLKNCDLYIWDLFDFWAEHGATEEVQIIGNRFDGTSDHHIMVGSCRPLTSNHLHKSLVIQNNVFAFGRARALQISAVDHLQEEGNVFTGDMS